MRRRSVLPKLNGWTRFCAALRGGGSWCPTRSSLVSPIRGNTHRRRREVEWPRSLRLCSTSRPTLLRRIRWRRTPAIARPSPVGIEGQRVSGRFGPSSASRFSAPGASSRSQCAPIGRCHHLRRRRPFQRRRVHSSRPLRAPPPPHRPLGWIVRRSRSSVIRRRRQDSRSRPRLREFRHRAFARLRRRLQGVTQSLGRNQLTAAPTSRSLAATRPLRRAPQRHRPHLPRGRLRPRQCPCFSS